MNKKYWFLLILLMIVVIFAACSNDSAGGKDNNQGVEDSKVDDGEAKDSDETVKLVVAYQWGEDSFNKRYKPIEKYLGNVELEYVPSNASLEGFEEMFAAGIKPDIIVDTNIIALQEMDVIYHLDELMEEEGFDLEIFDQSMLDVLRAYDDERRLVGLPDGTANMALYFNKEVFDLLGVPYPDLSEPMTWHEVIDLARKMTVERNGVQYIGLDRVSFGSTINQFSVTATDPKTGEVLINKEESFKKYFDLMSDYYSIPGIQNAGEGDAFFEKRAAMSVRANIAIANVAEDVEFGKPFELAPYPVWPELPTTGPRMGTTPMVIANYSEHKEKALEVLKAYFEPELILGMVREGGMVPPLADPEINKQYAKDVPHYEGKNLDAYHVLETARLEQGSKWDAYVDLNSAVVKIAEGLDVVTAMRELEEESEVKIKDAMAAE